MAEGGAAAAPAVILLHGWCASLYSFRQALVSLPSAGFRAIACDLRGFGLSDKPRGDPTPAYRREDFRNDLAHLVEQLNLGGKPVALIGHSLGGAIALDAAMNSRTSIGPLVLINPVGFSFPSSVLLHQFMPRVFVDALGSRAIPRLLVEMILRYVAFGDSRAISQQVIDQYWLPTQEPGFTGAAHATAAQFDWRPFTPGSLGALANPTLVIVGRRDRIVAGGASAARLMPNARVVEFDGGHCVHEEQPAAVWPLVADFLREGEPHS